DCPAGWFQVGRDEFKSCFLYNGAATTYMSAVKFCQEMDAFVPYLRVDDIRQKELAKRIDDIIHMRTSDSIDRYDTFTDAYDKQIWISGVTVPLTQCGSLSTRTGNIATQNCNYLLSFVCEKGILSYDEPTLWRGGIIIAVIALSILVVIILLLAICWYRKSRKREEEEVSRKECIRASLRLSKLANELRKNNDSNRIITNMATAGTLNGIDLQTDDAIMNAHRNLVHGKDNNSWSTLTKTDLSTEIYSGSNSVTSFIDQSVKYRPSGVELSKINSTIDSSYSGNTTETFTSHMPSSTSRNLVSQKPNPYAEVSLSVFNAYGSINDRAASNNDRSMIDRHNTDASTCSTNTDTVTCSTCQDCGESTLTERSSWNDSSSAQSSIISDRTIQQLVKPLLNRSEQLITKSMTGEDTLRLVPNTFDSRLRSYTYSKLIDISQPSLFVPKLQKNHGTSSVTSDETNDEIPLRPIRIAPPPPSTPSSPCIVTSMNEQLHVPLKIPTISSPPRRSLYETTTELVKNSHPYSSSSSYRTKIRPSIPPPNPPEYIRNPQSSQSLVDLINPSSLHYQRSNSTGKALPIETSM
ncbi:unnamed protein product, partial [Cercopithifilaria johnstoni]